MSFSKINKSFIAAIFLLTTGLASCKTSSSGNSVTSPSTADLNCSTKTQQTCAATPNCQLIGTTCTTISAALPTPTPTSNPSGTSMTADPTPTPTPDTAPFSYCAPYITPALCAAGPGCVWNGTSCALVGSGLGPQPTTCSPFTTSALCAAGLDCQWIGSSCIRPKVGLGTQFIAGDGLVDFGTSSNGIINCNFSAIFQTDGNLTIFQGNTSLWSSKTAGKGGKTLAFQNDGNLVIYDSLNKSIWSTATYGKGATGLLLSTAGNLAIVNAAGATLWISGTPVAGCN